MKGFILNGNYKDFSLNWYQNVGSSLCITMAINIITPHLSILLEPFKACISRCRDRGCEW